MNKVKYLLNRFQVAGCVVKTDTILRLRIMWYSRSKTEQTALTQDCWVGSDHVPVLQEPGLIPLYIQRPTLNTA